MTFTEAAMPMTAHVTKAYQALARSPSLSRSAGSVSRHSTHATPRTREILRLIALERARQKSLYIGGQFHFECCDPAIAGALKLPVLTEEFGEVGKALYELDFELGSLQAPYGRAHLREELIQLAAVATAWAESLI